MVKYILQLRQNNPILSRLPPNNPLLADPAVVSQKKLSSFQIHVISLFSGPWKSRKPNLGQLSTDAETGLKDQIIEDDGVILNILTMKSCGRRGKIRRSNRRRTWNSGGRILLKFRSKVGELEKVVAETNLPLICLFSRVGPPSCPMTQNHKR